MKNIIILCLLFVLFSSCEKEKSCTAIPLDDCFVTYELNPVCGCDEYTYANPSHANCNQIEFTTGACIYDNANLLGTWDFLGYVSDGAAMSVNKKVHKYDMFLTFKNDKINVAETDFLVTEGKSAVNFIGGGYRITNKGSMTSFVSFTTKIGVPEEDTESEDKFIKYLSANSDYKVQGNYLELISIIYSQDGLATPKDETLIFKKRK